MRKTLKQSPKIKKPSSSELGYILSSSSPTVLSMEGPAIFSKPPPPKELSALDSRLALECNEFNLDCGSIGTLVVVDKVGSHNFVDLVIEKSRGGSTR